MFHGALIAAGAALIAVSVAGATTVASPQAEARPAPSETANPSAVVDPLAKDITRLQAEVRRTPGNKVAWASLALSYVQQAKVTVNPSYYPKAEEAVDRSLAIDSTDNASGLAALAALRSAQHDFKAARSAAMRGLRIAPYNATLYGALNDAATQLGDYREARRAAVKLNELSPGVPAFTRVSYSYELSGDIASARTALEQALSIADSPADQAFVRYYLGELEFSQGRPVDALDHYEAGLKIDPGYYALLQGKARAEAALGRVDDALRNYRAVVAAAPQPEYVIEFADYLQSLGRTAEAAEQRAVFAALNELFESNGVALDTDPTLFYADRGQADKALKYGAAGIKIRPFVEMADAYAWALHAAGRDVEASAWSEKALALGTRNALFHFHAGMIDASLGDEAGARSHLTRALSINPHFNPVHAPAARAALAAL